MNTSKVWYITGASQGLGLTLVKKLLANGYRVAATSRNAQVLKEAVGLIDTGRFLPPRSGSFHDLPVLQIRQH